MDEYTKFVNQKLEDSDFLKYDAGVITKCNIVGYPQKGAEDTFSIGQPMFDAEGCLLGYLGIGLFDSLDYTNDKGIRIPVECWVIELPTRHCEVGKKIFTYWQNEQRKAEVGEMSDKYGECYCGDCISFNKCKSDKGTRINIVSEGCSCFEPNDIAKIDYPILPKWHDSDLLDKVAEKLKARYYYMETEEGWGGYTVTDKDIDEVIAEMKAGVKE